MNSLPNRRITLVHLSPDGRIVIHYEQRNKKGAWDYYTLSCTERGRPEFYEALTKLAPQAIDLLELPASCLPVEIRTIRFTYSGLYSTMGAVITITRRLRCGTSSKLKTPHRFSEPQPVHDAIDRPTCLSGECVDNLTWVMREALSYIDGDREMPLTLFPSDVDTRKARRTLETPAMSPRKGKATDTIPPRALPSQRSIPTG